jgi:uncharacterized protein (TIGR03083 family)
VNHDEAMGLAATEYERLLDAIDRLGPDDWGRPTDNDLWDVKAMLAHVLGTLESNASPDEAMRQQVAAAQAHATNGGYYIDALTDLQVREHVDLSPTEMAARIRATMPKALAGRTGMPEQVRATPMTPGPPFTGEWTLGFLIDTIYTRDTWMHRVDLCRATGQDMVLTPDHDGRIVADAVEEWAEGHGKPFTLVLTGPAGGSFNQGDDAASPATPGTGERYELDAVEFCRITSGRGEGTGLLSQGVAW